MFDQLQSIALYSIIPVAVLFLSGLVGIYKVPSAGWRKVILHFAAGIVFSVVAVELLPDIIKRHAPLQVIIGFVAGIILMLVVKQFAEKKSKEGAEVTPISFPVSFFIAMSVDILIDGLLLGFGFAMGAAQGLLLTIALSFEVLSLGIATATQLRTDEVSREKSIAGMAFLSVVFFVSAIIGGLILSRISDKSIEIVLSFGLAALLFLVTEELLVEAHEGVETPWYTSAFFAGFLLFLILGMVI